MSVSIDPAHFTRAVTAMGDRCPVTACRAIYNDRGVKVIDKGVRVDSRLYERLMQHQLRQPLADSLAVAPGLDANALRYGAERLIAGNAPVAALVASTRRQDQLLEELPLVPLPGPVAFQLSVMQETQPAAWDYALRSMVVAAAMAALQDDAARHDMRMLAAGGLLYDVGMLHVDPVLHDPRSTLNAEQRRHLYTHPLVSVMLLERHHEYPAELLRAVLEHHESLDGSGYPRGLADEAIGRWGRILALTKLAASLLAPGTPAAVQRLSVALRMNRHRYDTGLAEALARVLPAGPPVPLAGVPDPLAALRDAEAHLAAWPDEPPAGLPPSRRQAWAVLRGQAAQVRRILADVGADAGSLPLLASAAADDGARHELALIARETAWQLRVLARQARRRFRPSEEALPGWLADWLERADALCEPWLRELATATAPATTTATANANATVTAAATAAPAAATA